MAELVDLKQAGSVKKFHKQFIGIINLLQLSNAYALRHEISQSIKLFRLKDLNEGSFIFHQTARVYTIPYV